MKTKRLLLLTACLLLAAPLARAQVVSNTNSTGAGSLRAVVAAAASNATITFAAGLSGQTISLGLSQIVLNKNVTIDASALPLGIQITQPPAQLGTPYVRMFQVESNVTVSLKGLTLRGGKGSGYPDSAFAGGAIINYGTLSLTACTLYDNYTIDGGAIMNIGMLTINQCTLTGNSSDDGGAILNVGSLTINQSTLTGNSAGSGHGGGVYADSAGSCFVFNSIVAGNTAQADADIFGPYTPTGTNLIGGDPLLLPLGNYRGPAPTMPPRANSPALNAGADSATNNFATDQRGLPRKIGACVDIGAVELQPLTSTVNTPADAGPGSLRQAVADAEGGGVITFDPSLSGQTILLTSGQLRLERSVIIDALSLTGGIQLNGNGASRIFEVVSGQTVTLNALRIANGYLPYNLAAADYGPNGGGGILNRGALTLNACTLDGNRTKTYLTFGFAFPAQGGGILNDGGTLTLNQCTLTGNRAERSSASNSVVSAGGGIFSRGGAVWLNQCTLATNTAVVGGGLFQEQSSLTLFNCIVAGNSAETNDANIYGSYTAQGHNLTNGTPLLRPLGYYGGPTPTMPPLPDSPAVNMGDNAATNSFATDQRGWFRWSGSQVDLGAVELQPNVVGNTNDSGGHSLRDLVGITSLDEPITFAAGLSGQSIKLGSTLLLNRNLTIDASTLPGGIKLLGYGRTLEVPAGRTVVLRALEVRDGYQNQGGGIHNAGTLTLDRCTLANNGDGSAFGDTFTAEGGGIYNDNAGILTLNQCTLTGNFAKSGAAIYNQSGASLTVNSSTITGNFGDSGSGGIRNVGSLVLDNTLLAGNFTSSFSDPNLSGGGTLTLLGTNLTTGNPLLAALGNYGGPTATMPPLPGSPALDAGADAATNSFTSDQRGAWRRSGAGVDIGAVEVVAASGVPAVLTGLTRLPDGARQFTFTNLVAAGFTVWASTNVAAPLNTWANLGPAVEAPLGSGHYQFTDPAATNTPQRFYRVRSP